MSTRLSYSSALLNGLQLELGPLVPCRSRLILTCLAFRLHKVSLAILSREPCFPIEEIRIIDELCSLPSVIERTVFVSLVETTSRKT